MGLHDRIGKLLVDRGDADDFDVAIDLLARRPLQLVLGPDVARSETLQLVALLAADLGRRAFPAGVVGVLNEDGPILTGWPAGRALSDALRGVGASVVSTAADYPSIVIGDALPPSADPCVRAVPRGWAGGACAAFIPAPPACPGALGGILAAAVSVNEVFCAIHHVSARAAIRATGFSAWRPDLDWADRDAIGPDLRALPRDLWLLGLGHLGQAYAWAIRALPYTEPAAVRLVVQDVDKVEPENYATQLLSKPSDTGKRKTTVVADALRHLGMDVAILDRRFDRHQRRQRDEPTTVLVGLDDDEPRRLLSSARWDRVINVGLGGRADTFTEILLHRVEGDAPSLYAQRPSGRDDERLVDTIRAYQRLADADRCGAVIAAGKAVGTAFVGATASVMALAEVIRPLHGGPSSRAWHTNLRWPNQTMAELRSHTGADEPPSTPARQLHEDTPHHP